MASRPQSMNILHISSTLAAPLGGAEAYCVSLAIHQAKNHTVSVQVSHADDVTTARLRSAGVSVLTRRVWRPYRPDVRGLGTMDRLLFHSLDTIGAIVRPRGYRLRDRDGYDAVHIHRFQGIGSAILRGKRGEH